MAIGMTLQQLYSHPTYEEHATTADGSASASGPAPTSHTSAGASGSASTATPPHGRSPSYNDNKNNENGSSAMNHHGGMDRSTGPPQPPLAYGMPQHFQHYSQLPHHNGGFHGPYPTKNGPSTSEDYVADPLPFEYNGIRKPQYHDTKVQDHRLPPNMHPYADSYNPQAPHHAVYNQVLHPHKTLDEHPRQAPYHPQSHHPGGYAPHPNDRSHYHPTSEIPAHFPHSSHHSAAPHMYQGHNQSAAGPNGLLQPLTHSFPPLIDAHAPKKEVDQYAHQYVDTSSQPVAPPRPTGAPGTSQEAMIKVKTPLKLKYWRNGRRNLQCFPSCKVFGDYSAIKIEDLKQHDFMWGKCRGSIVTEVTLNSNVSFDDIVILGRVHSLENIPVAFEEAVIRECMLGRMVDPEVIDSMKDQWITGERLPDFVQQDSNVACFEFKPKVWKYTEDMAQGKCKRRNVKYYVQFEAFVLVMSGERRYYACIGSGMSTSFEVGSSRVLARQKRKAATSGSDEKAVNGGDMAMQQLHAHPMMPSHGMMAPHQPMQSSMYPPPNYHPHHENRGIPPTFPHPQMMASMHPQDAMQPPSAPNASQQPQPQQASVGTKRKLSSERPAAYPASRASKAVKVMGSV